jgi:hypothetical protein
MLYDYWMIAEYRHIYEGVMWLLAPPGARRQEFGIVAASVTCA